MLVVLAGLRAVDEMARLSDAAIRANGFGEGNWTKKQRKPVDEILFIDRMRPD